MLNHASLLDVAQLLLRLLFAAQRETEKLLITAVALRSKCWVIRCIKQRFDLVIGRCRRLALVAFQKVIKEPGQRGQFTPDCRSRQTAMLGRARHARTYDRVTTRSFSAEANPAKPQKSSRHFGTRVVFKGC